MRRCAAAVDEQRLGGTANARAAELRVEDDLPRHGQIGGALHEHVAQALQMADDGHSRFALHALDELFATARDDDIDVARHLREHVAHRGPIRGRDPLDARARQSRNPQPLAETGVDGGIRARALRAAPQDYRISRFQTQRARIGGPLADKVAITLSDENNFSREGTLDFIDNALDRSSGTIHARATVPNLELFLPPGRSDIIRQRVAHLNAGAAKWQIFELDERSEICEPVDSADSGNVLTRLTRAMDAQAARERFAASIARIRKLAPAAGRA